MVAFLVLTSVTFSLFGFIIGLWASGWEKLQIVPILIITPLAFLGGSFYSIGMLPPFWQKVTLFNPVVYLINGFRWAFYGIADVSVALSLGMTLPVHDGVPGRDLVGVQDRPPHQALRMGNSPFLLAAVGTCSRRPSLGMRGLRN